MENSEKAILTYEEEHPGGVRKIVLCPIESQAGRTYGFAVYVVDGNLIIFRDISREFNRAKEAFFMFQNVFRANK